MKYTTYEERYINHAPYLYECGTRSRRLDNLYDVGLVQITEPTKIQQSKIDKILKNIPYEYYDHVTFWRLCNDKYGVFVLTEPYENRFQSVDECHYSNNIVCIKLPIEVSPYCGYWSHLPEAKPKTRSFLYTSRLKYFQLRAIEEKLIKAAETAPAWNRLDQEVHNG